MTSNSEIQTRLNNEVELEDWQKTALEMQQILYEQLGNRVWDYVRWDQRPILESKIGFAMFGVPADNSEGNEIGYSKEKTEKIKKICDVIYKINECSCVFIAFLFVIGKGRNGLFIVPVFRVLAPNDTKVFLDSSGVVYNSWEDFIAKNKIRNRRLCYPKDGLYQADDNDRVLVTFVLLPAKILLAGLLPYIDKTASATAALLSVGGLVSIFVPLLLPLEMALIAGSTTCGVYGTARGLCRLRHNWMYKESISLRNQIHNLFANKGVPEIENSSATKAMAGEDEIFETACKIVREVLNVNSSTTNGIEIANTLAKLIKEKMKNEINKPNIVQFLSSILFFTNISMDIKTTQSIIELGKTEILSGVAADQSKSRIKAFENLLEKSGGLVSMNGKTVAVKFINYDQSKDEVFGCITRTQKQSNSKSVDEMDNLELNINPFSLGLSANAETRKRCGIAADMANIKRENIFGSTPENTCNVCSKCKKKLSFNGIKLYLADIIEKLKQLYRRYFPSLNNKSEHFSISLDLSEQLAHERKCKTKDYIDFFQFVIIYQKSLLKDMENRYAKAKIVEMNIMGKDFDEYSFDRKWGIQDQNDRECSFLRIINRSISEIKEDLKKKFDLYSQDVIALNVDGGLKFRTNYLALNAFYHSFVIDGLTLSPLEFFEMIREAAKDENFVMESQYFGNGNFKYVTYSMRDRSILVQAIVSKEEKFLESVFICSG